MCSQAQTQRQIKVNHLIIIIKGFLDECIQYASQRGMRGMRGRRARRARHVQNKRGMRGMNNPQHKLLTVKLTGELFKANLSAI